MNALVYEIKRSPIERPFDIKERKEGWNKSESLIKMIL